MGKEVDAHIQWVCVEIVQPTKCRQNNTINQIWTVLWQFKKNCFVNSLRGKQLLAKHRVEVWLQIKLVKISFILSICATTPFQST